MVVKDGTYSSVPNTRFISLRFATPIDTEVARTRTFEAAPTLWRSLTWVHIQRPFFRLTKTRISESGSLIWQTLEDIDD